MIHNRLIFFSIFKLDSVGGIFCLQRTDGYNWSGRYEISPYMRGTGTSILDQAAWDYKVTDSSILQHCFLTGFCRQSIVSESLR